MNQPPDDNTASGIVLLLVLGFQLLGLVILFRGMPIIGWLSGGIAHLFLSFTGVLLRGLVILVLLIAIYLLVAEKLADVHREASPTPFATDRSEVTHDFKH